ncbi:uncharacterized protein LOC128200092 [Galleria mellonella]|uniref:Uncharacterized protein LOC128200092 n=1 Tax=Galleria mellonella TaxID=7137 RepID=A0ABM3M9W2_GALME|nr:uncharacterized protein LOC128200092 [Galleria mellonella]
MSDIWTFHPLSEDEVLKCIALAPRPNDNNKWFRRFGHKLIAPCCNDENILSPKTNDRVEKKSKTPDPEDCPLEIEKNKIDSNEKHFEDFLEAVENDPILQFNSLVEECLKDNVLLTKLAQKLTTFSVEKICKHIYENENINSAFLEIFHKYFVPAYLKREHSCISLDILVRAHAKYPVLFKTLLCTILKDPEIPNLFFQDFISSIDETEQTKLLLDISNFELRTEEFINNIFSIYTAYKNSEKTDRIQTFILDHILQCGHICSNDKHFGRLLLAFLQAEKHLNICQNYGNIERIIEIHKSPFRRPCWNIFKELNKNNAL